MATGRDFAAVTCVGRCAKNAYTCTMGKKMYIYGSPRKCLMCDTVFTPRDKSSQAKYCSYSCNNKSRRIHKLKPCVICGTEFTLIRNGWVCCSRACGTQYRLSRHKYEPLAAVRKKLAVTCCGMIARSLRGKTDKTRNLLGYSVDQLRTHLESKFVDTMSWDNYGKASGPHHGHQGVWLIKGGNGRGQILVGLLVS